MALAKPEAGVNVSGGNAALWFFFLSENVDIFAAGYLNLLYSCYVPRPIDRTNPRVSPIFANPSSFPRSVTFITAEKDWSTVEANALADRLRETCDVVTYEAKNQSHGWDQMAKDGTRSAKLRDEAWALIARRLNEAFDDW